VFGDFYNLKSANRVILATNGPLPSLQSVALNSHRFSSAFEKFGFSGQSVLERFATRADWDTQARILTDQYSPANLLQ
jgi:spermidine synthase